MLLTRFLSTFSLFPLGTGWRWLCVTCVLVSAMSSVWHSNNQYNLTRLQLLLDNHPKTVLEVTPEEPVWHVTLNTFESFDVTPTEFTRPALIDALKKTRTSFVGYKLHAVHDGTLMLGLMLAGIIFMPWQLRINHRHTTRIKILGCGKHLDESEASSYTHSFQQTAK